MTDLRTQLDAPLRRLGLRAVAARAGISHAAIGNWLGGRNTLGAESLRSVAQAAIELLDDQRAEATRDLRVLRRVINAR